MLEMMLGLRLQLMAVRRANGSRLSLYSEEMTMKMYHYTECGLSNVWLQNGYSVKEIDGHKAVSISDADQLHEVIGRTLANKPYLKATELRFLRKELGLSQSRLAALLGTSEQTVSLWERKGRIPKGHDRLIRLLYIEKLMGM